MLKKRNCGGEAVWRQNFTTPHGGHHPSICILPGHGFGIFYLYQPGKQSGHSLRSILAHMLPVTVVIPNYKLSQTNGMLGQFTNSNICISSNRMYWQLKCGIMTKNINSNIYLYISKSECTGSLNVTLGPRL